MNWEKYKRLTPPIIRVAVGFLLVIFGVKACHRLLPSSEQVTLPADTKQRVTYNEKKHTLTTTTAEGTRTVYSRNPTIDLQKDGSLNVNAHQWGKELDPVLGFGYQDTRRVYAGVNVFYFRQFDLYAAVGIPLDNGHTLIKPLVGVSWNFWRNCALNAGVNPIGVALRDKPEIGIFMSVRL